MSNPQDHLGMYRKSDQDLEQAGIKGMRWGVRKTKYEAPSQKDRDNAVRAFTAKTGSPPKKGATIAVVNKDTNNLHMFKINKVKSAGLLSRKKIYDMSHEGTLAVDKKGKVTHTLLTPRKRQQTRTISVLHADDTPDYIGAHVSEKTDLEQAGVKGMKWGVRRDRGTLKAEAAKREGTAPATKAPAPKGNIQDNVESSSARYDRLASQAKSGKAKDMTEQDLKFFNARTDAIAKVEKMNQTDPSWLSKTSQKVIQSAAEKQMQSVADALANKYIGDPITAAIKGAAK